MPIEKQTRPYEILVRLDENGFVGAHYVELEMLVDTDTSEILQQKVGTPQAVTEQNVDSLISTANVTTMQDNTALIAQRDALQTQVDENDAVVTAKDAEIASLQTQITDLNAQLNPVDENNFAILTSVQIRKGLLALGIKPAQVDAAIAAIPDETAREQAFIDWEYSDKYHRNNSLIAQMGVAFNLTDEQIDAAWQNAANL